MTTDNLAPAERDTPAIEPPAARGMVFQVMPGVQRFVLSGAAIALGLLGLYAGQALLIPLGKVCITHCRIA